MLQRNRDRQFDVDFGSRALLRRHNHTYQDPTLVPEAVLSQRNTVHRLQSKLKPCSSLFFSNRMILDRKTIDKPIFSSGGLEILGDMEIFLMDYLNVNELLISSIVCKRWNGITRQDYLWNKFLITPLENYPIRQLLQLEKIEIYPSIQVYMIYHTIQRNEWNQETKSIHLGNLNQNNSVQTFSTWLTSQNIPLERSILSPISFQLLHGCIALISMNLTMDGISFESILIHHVIPIPLLQLSSLRNDYDLFRRRNEDELLQVDRHPNGSVFLSFLHCMMDISIGRELLHENLLHRLIQHRESMLPDFKSFIEYGIYIFATGKSLECLLQHPFLSCQPLTNIWSVDLHHQIDTSPAYLSRIVAWYTIHSPLEGKIPLHTFVPRTCIGRRALESTNVSPMELEKYRYTSLQAPSNADTEWLNQLQKHQGKTLHYLDLSQLTLPTSTILREIVALDQLNELILPHTKFCQPLESLVAAFPKHMKQLEYVSDGFLQALKALDISYENQLRIVMDAYGTNVQSA